MADHIYDFDLALRATLRIIVLVLADGDEGLLGALRDSVRKTGGLWEQHSRGGILVIPVARHLRARFTWCERSTLSFEVKSTKRKYRALVPGMTRVIEKMLSDPRELAGALPPCSEEAARPRGLSSGDQTPLSVRRAVETLKPWVPRKWREEFVGDLLEVCARWEECGKSRWWILLFAVWHTFWGGLAPRLPWVALGAWISRHIAN